MTNKKKKCFVIMPFSSTKSCSREKWTETFEFIIKPAVEESGLGYECKRYGLGRANIVKDILEDLNRAQVVIADLTDDNANVLWELGVRHTLSKRTILISQDKKFIPSDLKDYPVIFYDRTKAGFDKFKEDIKSKLEDIEANPDKPDSPVADFLQDKNIHLLSYEKKISVARLTALLSELSFNVSEIDFIFYKLKQSLATRKVIGKVSPRPRLDPVPHRLKQTCLQLLVTNQYIVLPQEFLEELMEVNSGIEAINRYLDTRDLYLEQAYGLMCEVIITQAFFSDFKEKLFDLLRKMNKVKLDYLNNNYIEPEIPAVVLSRPVNPEDAKVLKEIISQVE